MLHLDKIHFIGTFKFLYVVCMDLQYRWSETSVGKIKGIKEVFDIFIVLCVCVSCFRGLKSCACFHHNFYTERTAA